MTRVSRQDDDSLVMEVATDADTATACPSRGVFSTSAKGRVTTQPKDILYGDQRIKPRWNKTRWRCREEYRERGSFTYAIEKIPRRARITGRLRTRIGAAIGNAARSVVEVAAAHNVSWPTAHRTFVERANRLLTEPEPVRVLGIDETGRGKPRWEYYKVAERRLRVNP
ncbi:helix-turn-helix domain-containing protein [Rhodococcus sp. APC 3903]|uniref:helix-turn-helix domain-containing protein n=1 Tax=Rhodococcus sp. APC 3903 TaxID=3035193 RepID=UPI0025B3716A|nr:helix-turn-helix domain-containing protein [Rhodococcus sp. APC 3903]MDN3460681.1 helix-turn-helix domain-containing protein [Rhodococcus sp. APC 3903]